MGEVRHNSGCLESGVSLRASYDQSGLEAAEGCG
jgi:hypothetical protein